MRVRIRTAAGILGAVAGAALALPTVAQPDGPPPATVQVQPAARQPMASVVMAPGNVVAINDARISAELAGRLTWVANVGDEIEAGGVIARMEDRELQLKLRTDEAGIRRLEASLEYVEQQLARLQQLVDQNNAARDRIDEQTSQKLMAEQDLVQARVERERTLYDLERSTIRAPFGGQIVERLRQAGEYITVGGPVARLVDTTHVEVRAQAPIAVAQYLLDGMPVTVADEQHSTENEIRRVIPVGDERSRMIEVRIALDGQPWPIGSAVRVALPTSEPTEVVAVPRDALILRADQTFLFKVGADNTVEQVPVQTGIGNGSHIEVRGDVADGDQIVTRGGERLRPGQPVTVNGDG